MGIKLIAMDMDGTLFRDDHRTISRRTVAAVQKAAERGVHIVLASGRARLMMGEAAHTLGCVRYMVTANGGVVLDRVTGEELWTRLMTVEQSAALLETVDRLDLPSEMYCHGEIYVARRLWHLPEERPAEYTRLRDAFETAADSLPLDLKGLRLEKADLEGRTPEQEAAILEMARRVGSFHVSLTDNSIELCHAEADKGAALAALCEKLGVAPEEVMAFGDGDNDKQMLAWAGYSFAMGNAMEAARRAAKAVTASNEADGIARAVEEFVLK